MGGGGGGTNNTFYVQFDICFLEIITPPHLSTWPKIWQFLYRELNIKVVVFVLKKILTYFEMLIGPHALHCVDSCIFVFTSFDTVWHTVLVSVHLVSVHSIVKVINSIQVTFSCEYIKSLQIR